MDKLALKLPGGNNIDRPPNLNPEFKDLGSFISPFLNIVFYVAMLFALTWLVWGAYQYILAQGKKEELAKARARITWALIGLIVVFLAYLIAKFAAEIFPANIGGTPF